ncbi:MAG: hypothetical protein M0Z47_07360 [Actinomycetota bacterium]|nr:hypothetical protein [Actinomycetota bacterium]
MKLARSGVASLVLAVALFFGWVAVTAYLFEQSFFAPSRFANATESALSSPSLRSSIANAITMDAYGDTGAFSKSSADQVNAALQGALLNKAVQQEFATAMNNAQKHIMGLYPGNVTFGGPVLADAVAENLLAVNPQLAALISQQASTLQVSIPGTTLPDLGKLYRNIGTIERDALLLAIGLAIIALLIAPRRSTVLTEIGIWLVVMSFVEALIFWIAPTVVIPLTNASWAPVVSQVLKAIGGPAISTYAALLIGGGVFVVLGRVFRRA